MMEFIYRPHHSHLKKGCGRLFLLSATSSLHCSLSQQQLHAPKQVTLSGVSEINVCVCLSLPLSPLRPLVPRRWTLMKVACEESEAKYSSPHHPSNLWLVTRFLIHVILFLFKFTHLKKHFVI